MFRSLLSPSLLALLAILLLAAFPVGSTESEPTDTETGPATAAEDPTVAPPQIILVTQKAPVYPPAALAGRFTGMVKVEVKVLADGSVGEAQAIECDHPNLGFEEASVAAVKQWRFEPAKKNGTPIDFVTSFRLNFRTEGTGENRKAYVSAGSAPLAESSRRDTVLTRDTTVRTPKRVPRR
jgi:TonB family protein